MDKIINKYYIIDNIIFKNNYLNNQFNNIDYQFYEVLRTTKGVLLFIDDHLERLQESLKCLDLFKYYNNIEAKKCLHSLIQKNNYQEGNIKLLCKVANKQLIYASYYISHYYPTKDLYTKGIKLKSYIIERSQPNIKQIKVNEFIKSKISDILSSKEFFEVLLVNKDGNITEGSKSNFFIIKANTVFSAPESQILKGITRKYVIEIIKDSGLNFVEKDIPLIDLATYDSAFICGTSPKVLPVKEIDGISFSPNNRSLKLIMQKYNLLFSQYIEEYLYHNY